MTGTQIPLVEKINNKTHSWLKIELGCKKLARLPVGFNARKVKSHQVTPVGHNPVLLKNDSFVMVYKQQIASLVRSWWLAGSFY